MKNLVIMLVAAVAVFAGFAAELANEGSTATATTNLDTRATLRRRRQLRPHGGILERKRAIPSRQIAVVNRQSILSQGEVEAIIQKCRRASRLPMRLDAADAPVSIQLIDDGKSNVSLTINPDSYSATVNVRALCSDGKSKEQTTERGRKQVIRAALFVLGAGYSGSPCLANPVGGLAELDALNPRFLSMETMSHLNAMPKLGISEIVFYTYRQACREGWAPQPTNDVQKAIWDEIHALPTEPIKIKPETKKVSD